MFIKLRVIFPLLKPSILSTKANLYKSGILLVHEFDWLKSQTNPASLVHVELQPSFDLVFPSSHSASKTIPSPHVSVQMPSLSKSLYPDLQRHRLLEAT